MPQPLRKPCHSIEWTGLDKRPEHAAALGRMVAVSAQVEHCLGYMLAALNGGAAAISFHMFSAVNSVGSQRAMLRAAAERALKDSPTELATFNSLMADWKSRYEQRSRLVHNLWGCSDEYPDHALWCHVSDGTTLWTALGDMIEPKDALQTIHVVRNMWTKTYLYTVSDIDAVTRRLDRYVESLMVFLNDQLSKKLDAIAKANGLPGVPPRTA